MKKIFSMLIIAIMAFSFTGCYDTVPVGTVGKKFSEAGIQPEIYPPSKVWLSNNIWNRNKEQLILVETTTKKYKETITVLLADKLTLTADVLFVGRVTTDRKVLDAVFNDIKLDEKSLRVNTDEVYNVYGRMLIRNTAREILSQYNVDEINVNYARITKELKAAIRPLLVGLPIEISDVTLGNIQYPDIVTTAIEKAKERRMLIEQEEANVQIALTKAKGKEEVAKATYRIKMLEARQVADYNKKISEGVTQDLLRLRQLEVQEKMVEAIKENKNVVYMPFDMMNGATHMRTLH